MDNKKTNTETKKCCCCQSNQTPKDETISYRLKCEKTANGLSHFVMYGDVPKEKSLV
ncbi:MAG: hypothetical protein ABIF11_10185 [Nitrospirota bacterium]